jgi:hypothetical protein
MQALVERRGAARRITAVKLIVVLLVAVMAAGLAACNMTVRDRISAAAATTRATKPLVEWVEVRPEHLSEVNPDRLRGEGAALVIARSVRESAAGERTGASSFLLLRDVSTSTIRSGPVQRTGTDAEVGWVVLLVPPGQYALNRGAVRQTTSVRHGEARVSYVDTKGHPFVPLGSTTRIGAGDVVYVGTVVWQAEGPVQAARKVSIRDERSAATQWVAANLPDFTPHMQTRLLPPPVAALN